MYFFDWNLMIVTPASVTRLLMANGIVFENEGINHDQTQSVVQGINARVEEYLEILLLENPFFLDKLQSLLASSIVYLARKEEFSLLQLSPDAWNSELQDITGYCELDLIEVAESLKSRK